MEGVLRELLVRMPEEEILKFLVSTRGTFDETAKKILKDESFWLQRIIELDYDVNDQSPEIVPDSYSWKNTYYLLNKKEPIDNLLIEASKVGNLRAVKILIDNGANTSADNNFAIRWASYNGYVEIVKLLLADLRVDPSANKNEAIRTASQYGHPEIVKLLLADSRVDLSNRVAIAQTGKPVGFLVPVMITISPFD